MAGGRPKGPASAIDAALAGVPTRISRAQNGLSEREAKTLAKVTNMSVTEYNAHIAERLDGIIGQMVGRMEKEVGKFSIGQLPLATAILADKAAQYRGQALASGGSSTTINVQINGLDRDSMKQALAGVANMGRKGKAVASMGKVGPKEVVSEVTPRIETVPAPAKEAVMEAEIIPSPTPPGPTENSTSKGQPTQ